MYVGAGLEVTPHPPLLCLLVTAVKIHCTRMLPVLLYQQQPTLPLPLLLLPPPPLLLPRRKRASNHSWVDSSAKRKRWITNDYYRLFTYILHFLPNCSIVMYGRKFELMDEMRSLQGAVGTLELGMRNYNVCMLCYLFWAATHMLPFSKRELW